MSKPDDYTPDFHVVLNHELDQVQLRRKALHDAGLIPELPKDIGSIPPCETAVVVTGGDAKSAIAEGKAAITTTVACLKEVAAIGPSTGEGTAFAESGASSPEEKRNDEIRQVRDRAKKMDLFGVSFSGGGIRSATFSLGILQALGKLKLLRHVDYLSTVSGGGYIGGWLAAWIRRETDGLAQPPFADANAGATAVENVERQLDPDRTNQARSHRLTSDPSPAVRPPNVAEDREPAPIHHLRAHSRYLSPRTGLLSLDTWAILAIYLRNLFVNALVVLPLLAFVVLAARSTVRFYAWPESPSEGLSWSLFGTAVGFLVVAAALMAIRLSEVRSRVPKPESASWWWHPRMAVFALLITGFLAVWVAAPDAGNPMNDTWYNRIPSWLDRLIDCIRNWMANNFGESARPTYHVLWGSVFALLSVAVSVVLLCVSWWHLKPGESIRSGFRYAFFRLFLAFAFGVLVEVWDDSFLYAFGTGNPRIFATFGPPSFLGIVLLAGYIEVALAGGWYTEYEREWRSRLASWMFLLAVGWVAVFATVIYLPQLLDNRGGTATTSAVVVLTAAIRFLAPKLTAAPGMLTWVAVKVVPVVFLVALLALVASGVDRIVREFPSEDSCQRQYAKWRAVVEGKITLEEQTTTVPNPNPALPGIDVHSAKWVASAPDLELSYADWLEVSTWRAVLVATGIAGVVFFVFVLVVPVNRFSLHSMCANRLIRCYLGASQRPTKTHLEQRACVPTAVERERKANTFSGFDPDDDLPLIKLRTGTGGGAAPKSYFGPFPIFNSTINMVAGTELAVQDRRGESFALTPYYSGSNATGFALLCGPGMPDDKALKDPMAMYWNLTVGRAVTISGAAVDPNMTNFYSPQFTAFLTIMNARLGWWIQNPRNADPKAPAWGWWDRMIAWWKDEKWGRWDAIPPFGSWNYVKELLGYTDAAQSNVHLSDGGHYENTGAYELIRRRCRFVLIVDAAENPDNTSENLANLVRLVRSDFGIRILIDTGPLKRGGADGRTSEWHCAIGAIRYDDVDDGGVVGTLLFVRSSLTGDEPPDVKNYAAVTPVFPHHSTGDQFFDETMFESYRGLGYHIGMSVLAEAAERTERRCRGTDSGRGFHRTLFSHLRRQWLPSAVHQDDNYIESCERYLRYLAGNRPPAAREIVGEDGERIVLPDSESPTKAELHEVNWRVQMYEVAWLQNGLDGTYSHPIQRGWITSMREYTASPAFQRCWPIIRSAYSQGFVRFCEGALNANPPSVKWCNRPDAHDRTTKEWRELAAEFETEFLAYFLEKGKRDLAATYLAEALDRAGRQFWLVGDDGTVLNDGEREATKPLKRIAGVIAVLDTPLLDVQDDDRELFIWIRGGSRLAGFGGTALRGIVRAIRDELKTSGKKLFARFPFMGRGAAEQLQGALWIQFMNDFDFYGVPPTGAEWEERELRVQYLPEGG